MSEVKTDVNSTIEEIQGFFDGNGTIQYIVNIETYYHKAIADCFIQKDDGTMEITKVPYINFLYIKDYKKLGFNFYNNDEYKNDVAKKKYGIDVVKLNTGNHPRLENGYVYKISSTKSYNSITSYLKDGGIDLNEIKKNTKDKNDSLVYSLKLQEQFFISTGNRLFKGFEEYKNINKLIFDFETTGLNPNTNRLIQAGLRNNRGFEYILEVSKENDDLSEAKIIKQFFYSLSKLNPAVIAGYNSELFDFDFIVKRTEILQNRGVNIGCNITTSYNTKKYEYDIGNNKTFIIERKANSSVKIGGSTEKYTATHTWGFSYIDILHAVKRAAAVNTNIKQTSLKEICKFSKIAKKDRMYIKGDKINKYWKENKIFTIDYETNTYKILPNKFQEIGRELLNAQKYDKENDKYFIDTEVKKKVFTENKEFLEYISEVSKEIKKFKFISGKEIVNKYLLDDLWETEQVDERFNQSSFLLAKIVPTHYSRICTMGSAAIWNLLMVTWSYQNNLAIPLPDVKEKFPGGHARCYKKGWAKNIRKLDFAGLYPSLQLTYDIFPTVDITGVLKKMLTFLSHERNKYKKLMKKAENDHDESLEKFYDAKQQPLKVLNNSMFGALGSNIAFNWGDNNCASRITCTGRLHLRKMIKWFTKRDCTPLLAVTDGVNFSYPDFTTIDIDGNNVHTQPISTEQAWQYNGKTGIAALVEYYNQTELSIINGKKSYIKVDDDGSWVSTLNVARINYANLTPEGKLKITGNSIKSKVMPEYIEEFINKGLLLILQGKGSEFVEYYYSYVEDIYYKRIPLKKIASKKKYKHTISQYLNRGVDKNNRVKAKMAYMELIIEQRNKMMIDEYIKLGHELDTSNPNIFIEKYKEIKDKVQHLLPPEPEIGTTIYLVNTGKIKSHGDSQLIFDEKIGKERLASTLVSAEEIEENPDMLGDYNVGKYLDAFNTKVKSLLEGFDPKVRNKIRVKDPSKREYFTEQELILKNFDNDSLEESMTLEEAEINFWNKTGLNPYNVFSDFIVPESYPLYLNLYDEKLKKANELMKSTGNREIKSINDNYGENDFVLFKNKNVYDLYLFKNSWFRLVKGNINIPETESERIQREQMEELSKPLNTSQPHDFYITRLMKQSDIDEMIEWVKKFKKKFKLKQEQILSEVIVEDGKTGIDYLYDWIDIEKEKEEMEEEYENDEEGD